MTRASLASLLWSLCAVASAQQSLVHVVRPGETLASIAEAYYGEPRREGAIVSENGMSTEGGSPIVVGQRLVIPTVRYHRVEPGQTWAALADQYYGDSRRAFALIDANGASAGKQPDVGAEIVVPYPLRYASTQHDPLRQAAREHYDGSNKSIQMVRRFNGLKTSRVGRGELLLLPLSHLVLSARGKKLAEQQGLLPVVKGEIRDKQLQIEEQLPRLRDHVERGRFVEAVAMANQLIGGGDVTGNQIVTIQRELGTALVALERDDLAVEAFKRMLEKQPDVELSVSTTSPKVLRVLDAARTALAKAKVAAAAPAAAPAE